ncbi:hypothetical protein Kisp01_54510 [Kineosporia sp. NBRC 101677]|nr:hypothetical protein Kisp01_54510 [Kineosporia sp. NBRC 101677]
MFAVRRTVGLVNRGEQPVHSITGAVSPHSDDLDARIRRYLISMSLRVVCVVMAIVVHARWGHWSWWIFALGAVVLPYVAVVMANAVDKKRGGPGAPPVTPQTRYVLPPVADDEITMTIHPPQRPAGPDAPDSRDSAAAPGTNPGSVRPDSPVSPDQSE